jgi:hypothetical protein
MLVKCGDKTIEIDLDQREMDMLDMSITYFQNAFGAPNHLLMVLVVKLWKYIREH